MDELIKKCEEILRLCEPKKSDHEKFMEDVEGRIDAMGVEIDRLEAECKATDVLYEEAMGKKTKGPKLYVVN